MGSWLWVEMTRPWQEERARVLLNRNQVVALNGRGKEWLCWRCRVRPVSGAVIGLHDCKSGRRVCLLTFSRLKVPFDLLFFSRTWFFKPKIASDLQPFLLFHYSSPMIMSRYCYAYRSNCKSTTSFSSSFF